MAHLALVSPPLRGHLDPMSALGRELARRGHRVTLIADADSRGLADAGLEVFRLAAGLPALSGGDRQPSVLATVRAMAARFEALCDVLPDALRQLGVDAVICDQTEPAGALSALACGLRYASLAAALPLNREPGLPPPYVDWAFRPDGSRRWLYEGGHRVVDILMRPLDRAIGRRSAAFGIDGMKTIEDTFSSDLQLLQLVPGLDFPRESLPCSARYVGPLRDPRSPTFAFEDDGRPLAFCSLGTLQGFRLDLFRIFAATLSAAGFRPVIVHGGRLPADAVSRLPGDPIVADFLPQRAVLARCSLAITHGGMNTVLDALAAGVPLIVTPLAYEQGAIAARVTASGAGLVIRSWQVRRQLADACRAVIEQPRFTAEAGRLATEIAASGGVRRAASLFEAMLDGASPVLPGDDVGSTRERAVWSVLR